jgi:hypothetical protein
MYYTYKNFWKGKFILNDQREYKQVKLKLSPCLIKYHAMKMYGGVPFLTLTLESRL